jgi:glycosyltransferase XagB
VFAPLLPAYWAMHWAASWRGLYQLIRAPFLWEKTPHPATTTA